MMLFFFTPDFFTFQHLFLQFVYFTAKIIGDPTEISLFKIFFRYVFRESFEKAGFKFIPKLFYSVGVFFK